MKAGFHQDYPASIDRLWQVFGQPDYPERKYRLQGVTAYEVREFVVTPTTIALDLLRTLSVPADKIPAFVRRLVPAEQTLHYVSHWRRSAADLADFDLDIVAVDLPVQVKGKGQLRQLSENCSRLSIDVDIAVHVPLIGHKIEQMLAAQIEKSFREDHAFTLGFLDGQS